MGEAVSPLCAVSVTTVTTFLSQCCMTLLLLFLLRTYFIFQFLLLFIFWSQHAGCGILVP